MLITTILEVIACALIVIGFCYEPKVVDFENKMVNKWMGKK